MQQPDITIASLLKDFAKFFKAENIIKNLPYFFMLGILGIIYIANANLHLQIERKIDQKDKEVKHLSWEYMTTKSEVMYSSKQSEIAKKVKKLGVKPLVVPPQIIELEDEEH